MNPAYDIHTSRSSCSSPAISTLRTGPLTQIAMVVALEVLYPSHFSLVYGGNDEDGDEEEDDGNDRERSQQGRKAVTPSSAGVAPEPYHHQQQLGSDGEVVPTSSSAAVASAGELRHHHAKAAAAPDGIIGVLDTLGGNAAPDHLDHSLHTPLEV